MSPTEQAQRLAEEYANKQMGIPDFNKELSNPQNKTIHESLEDGFIAGFSASRWIEVTPDSMPEEGAKVWASLEHFKSKNRRYYELKRVTEWGCDWRIVHDNSEIPYEWTATHYQVIEPPKPSKQ